MQDAKQFIAGARKWALPTFGIGWAVLATAACALGNGAGAKADPGKSAAYSPPANLPDKGRALGADERYPYSGKEFDAFIADSYRANRAGPPTQFRAWMEAAYSKCSARYPGMESLSLVDVLHALKARIAQHSERQAKAASEYELGVWLHKMVKTTIPKFSLDRGYEFVNTVKYGERQCFLQSVLIAGLLQEAGVNAGVEMVYRNIAGELLNNGHAICLIKLSDGKDVIIDASDPTPSVKQHGLYVRTTGYAFLEPVFAGKSDFIAYYRPEMGGKGIPTSEVRTLDRPFIFSQFWHYRGERVGGGIVNGPRTQAGLKAAQTAFETALKWNASNPLATYFLGRVYLAEGDKARARATLAKSNELYAKAGWVPAGQKEFFALANR